MGRHHRYSKIEFLGEGQFATVFKATDNEEGGVVAVKKIKIGNKVEALDGINRTALREIKLLQELRHENLIGLLDVFGHKSNISLVYDFMDTDLEVIIKDKDIVLTQSHIKAYMIMTLKGIEYLHRMWVLHRDLKPNNLLVNRNGVLKIGDFGLAKCFGSPSREYTHQVVTRWYRAPELLFGARLYGEAVDIWAIGCILAELMLRVPFLPGDTDLSQLTTIFQTLGTPTDEDWPEAKHLPDYVSFKHFPGVPLVQCFSAASDKLISLISGLLACNPAKRISATKALNSPFFLDDPPPTHSSKLPLPSGLIDSKVKNLKRKSGGQGDGTNSKKRLIF